MEPDTLGWSQGLEGCIGENTREQGVFSAIDFVLINQSMYQTFENMHIDEQRREFDLSDHFLIKTTFLINQSKESNMKIKPTEVSYYKLRGPYWQVIRGSSFFFLMSFKSRYGIGNNV